MVIKNLIADRCFCLCWTVVVGMRYNGGMREGNANTGKIIVPAGVRPWPHELRVAEVLAAAGHRVEFLPEG